jgi:hypothetical protein
MLRVRRDSDNSEQDIGQLAGVLDRNALEIFCGGGEGYMTTFYDQSGSGNDLVQATAADQPFIIDNTTFVDPTTKLPRAQFTNKFLQISQAGQLQPTTTVMAISPINHTSGAVIIDGGSATLGHQAKQSATPSVVELNAGSAASSAEDLSASTVHILAYRINGSSSTIEIDNTGEDSGLVAGANTPLGLTVGADAAGGNDADFYLHELIYFNSALSASDLKAVRDNMNAYYKVY